MTEQAAEKPTFDSLPLTAEVKKALTEMGYVHPTPVQIACYDPVVRGQDVIVQARTGTGKTTAFGLPLIDQVVRKSGALQVLALCPTRELALQVAAELTKIGKHKGVKVTAVYGGAPMGRQIAELEDGAQVVVGTPGRVLDHLRRGTMDPKGLRAFVLDEADEMLSMGFEKELNHIVDKLPKTKQTMLFSATMSNEVSRLVREMKEPETILLSGDQVGALELTHYFYLSSGEKAKDLLKVLDVEDPQSAIIFCNTKDETERVAKELRKAGYPADYISGDLEQKERERVLSATREGRLRFLVATDVAARGIDISHLTHVVNHDFPDSAEQYVHRTGRTGRAGRTGTAISLISPKDIGNLYYLRLTYGLKPIERNLPTESELAARREADLLAKVEALGAAGANVPAARALARRLLTHDDAEGLIAALLREVLGAQLVSADEAQKARRAKNPPPVAEAAPPPSSVGTIEAKPETKPETRNERPARAPREEPRREEPRRTAGPVTADRPREPRPEREPRRGGKFRGATTELTEWSPPDEPDDELPIVSNEQRRQKEQLEGRPERPREPREERPRDERPRPERTREVRPREERAQQEEKPREEPNLPEVTTLFVNSGRRDGLKSSDLLEVLDKRGAIEPEAVGRVRLRDRNTFVDVRPDVADRAIAALRGAIVHGRTLNAELARPRDPSAPREADDERPTNPIEDR